MIGCALSICSLLFSLQKQFTAARRYSSLHVETGNETDHCETPFTSFPLCLQHTSTTGFEIHPHLTRLSGLWSIYIFYHTCSTQVERQQQTPTKHELCHKHLQVLLNSIKGHFTTFTPDIQFINIKKYFSACWKELCSIFSGSPKFIEFDRSGH